MRNLGSRLKALERGLGAATSPPVPMMRIPPETLRAGAGILYGLGIIPSPDAAGFELAIRRTHGDLETQAADRRPLFDRSEIEAMLSDPTATERACARDRDLCNATRWEGAIPSNQPRSATQNPGIAKE